MSQTVGVLSVHRLYIERENALAHTQVLVFVDVAYTFFLPLFDLRCDRYVSSVGFVFPRPEAEFLSDYVFPETFLVRRVPSADQKTARFALGGERTRHARFVGVVGVRNESPLGSFC